jgi:hypothetical protein
MKSIFALLFTCSSLAAQHYSYIFTNVPLWDITGPFTNDTSADTITGSFLLRANGQFNGVRIEINDQNGDHLEGSAFINGRLMATPSQVEVRYSWQGTYSGVVGGKYILATDNVRGNGLLIPITHSIEANSTTRFCIRHGKCSTSYDGFELALQPGMDGTWRLDVDVSPTGNKLNGQAVLTLSTGRSFIYQILGTQNVKRGSAILRLKGINEATTSFLTLYTQGGDQTLVKLQGRLLGQKLNVQQ